MTDVFFSYSSKDRERVRPIRDALVAEGLDVFWDQDVPLGRNWDEWIRQHLDDARCVIVFWSAHSVKSDNVVHEATIAKNVGKLIPVLLDPLEATQFPMGHYTTQGIAVPPEGMTPATFQRLNAETLRRLRAQLEHTKGDGRLTRRETELLSAEAAALRTKVAELEDQFERLRQDKARTQTQLERSEGRARLARQEIISASTEFDLQIDIIRQIAGLFGRRETSPVAQTGSDSSLAQRAAIVTKYVQGLLRVVADGVNKFRNVESAEFAKSKTRITAVEEQNISLKINITRLEEQINDAEEERLRLEKAYQDNMRLLDKVSSREKHSIQRLNKGLPEFLSKPGLEDEFDFFDAAKLKKVAGAERLDAALRRFKIAADEKGNDPELFTSVHEVGQALYELMDELKQPVPEQYRNARALAEAIAVEGKGQFSISVVPAGTIINTMVMAGGEAGDKARNIQGWAVKDRRRFVVRKALVQ